MWEMRSTNSKIMVTQGAKKGSEIREENTEVFSFIS